MKVITFWRMPFSQKAWFFANFILCGLARATVKLLPFKRITPYFGTFCHMTTTSTIINESQRQKAILIGRSIKLAARYTPWNSNCLAQAMVAKFWCQHYKIPYMFFIGFAKSKEKPSGYDGHAWVTAWPIALTGGHCIHTHKVVMSYTLSI